MAEVVCDAVECLGGAHKRVGCCALGDLLAPDGILLVSERERGGGHKVGVHVIQRVVGSGVDAVAHEEVGVAEAESLGSFVILGRGVFARAEEPEEGCDGEVNDLLVGSPEFGVHGVKDERHVADDRDIGRVGALGRVVAVPHGFEERSQ